jgi:glycosyltransferase involved in cell wall biosynthesis
MIHAIMTPQLSIVIATHNRRDLLRTCLMSLDRQTTPPTSFEVVVVLDGCTDGSDEIVDELALGFRLSAVQQPLTGAPTARNAGAAHALGRILLFIDDDEEAARGLVAGHLDGHARHQRAACFGMIDRRVPPNADRFARIRAAQGREHNEHLRERPFTYLDGYGGNVSVTREAFDEVGGYAVDLRRENDFDFAYRLHRVGVELVFLPDAVVTEYRTNDWRQQLTDSEMRGSISVELYRRHPPMIEQMELARYRNWSRTWRALRACGLALRVPSVALAPPGFVMPRDRWARAWFRYVWNYAHWRGIRAAADPELWRAARAGTLRQAPVAVSNAGSA